MQRMAAETKKARAIPANHSGLVLRVVPPFGQPPCRFASHTNRLSLIPQSLSQGDREELRLSPLSPITLVDDVMQMVCQIQCLCRRF